MNEKMMQWSDDTLIAEYWLNIRLNGEEDDPSDRRCSYETIQEIKEVAAARGVDLDSKFLGLVDYYRRLDADDLQAEYVRNFRARQSAEQADEALRMEAIFDAADANGIELSLPPLESF